MSDVRTFIHSTSAEDTGGHGKLTAHYTLYNSQTNVIAEIISGVSFGELP
jgi:hypothetical protein